SRRPGVELPALEPLQRQRLVRPLGRRARARRLTAVLQRLEEGFAAWRRLGPRRGTAAVVREARRIAKPPVRRLRVRVAAPRASHRAVARALGGVDAFDAIRGPVRAAMPTVVAWEAELENERESIVARADAMRAHRFDLLGSGPTDLGPEIPW